MREGGLLCMMAIRHIIVVLFFIEQDVLEMKIKHKSVCCQAKLLICIMGWGVGGGMWWLIGMIADRFLKDQ